MIKTSIILFILFYMVSANSQQTIDKLNSNQLKLPKETIQKALSIDAAGQVKSSTTSDAELGYLSGTTSSVQTQLNNKANDADAVHLTGNESISGIKTFNGKLITSSTTNASLPCPVMTQAQRDLIASPVVGDCVFNDDADQANIYDGSIWKSMGGSGGISLWLTATGYAVDDVVIESNKIYICLTAHTSGTFATDLAATKWLRVSTDIAGATGILPTANGGSGASITPVLGSVVATNGSTMELVAAGNAGEILQSNGTSTPSFVPKSISAKAENGSSVTLEEIQVPNNQLTTTATNKHLLNDCGSSNNLLANCGFEHSTPATGWTLTNGSSAVETSNVKQGKKSLKLTLTAQSLDFYQTSILNVAAFADGVNGSISLAIKTTVDNVYLCRTDSAGAVVASTDGTKITNCVKAPNTGKWSDLVMPIILGATSNGLRLVSLTPSTAASVAVTGDVYVDQGILEAGLKTQVANNIGPWTTFTPTGTWTTNTTYTGKYRQVGENYEYQMEAATSGAPTATTLSFNLPSGHVIDTAKMITVSGNYPVIPSSATTSLDAGIQIFNSQVGANTSTSVSPLTSGATLTNVNIGLVTQAAPFTFGSGDKVAVSFSVPIVSLSGASSVYSIPSDSFSTDSNTLAHKTTAIASTDPIGTYNTYSYAINTNTKTICGTAPSILPNAADGFKIFTRAYNAASTCGNPARVEIKIGAAGTKFPTIKTDIYKSAAKVTSMSPDKVIVSSTAELGFTYNAYDEATGVIVIDSGAPFNATTTSNQFAASDGTGSTSGFLVINAQKMKDSIVGSFAEVVTSIGTTSPDIQSVYFGSSADCSTVCTTGNCTICNQVGNKITSVSFSSTGVYNVNGIDGTKYSCTGNGVGATQLAANHQRAASTSTIAKIVFLNPSSANANASLASVTCHGKP